MSGALTESEIEVLVDTRTAEDEFSGGGDCLRQVCLVEKLSPASPARRLLLRRMVPAVSGPTAGWLACSGLPDARLGAGFR
jgi:hypothetical protein